MARSGSLPDELRPISALAEATADLVAVAGPDDKLLFVSRASERLLGERPEGLRGRRLAEFIHPEDQARLAAARPGSGAEAIEVRLVAGGSGYRWCELRTWHYLLAGVAWTVSIAHDVQSRKEAEETARRARQTLAAQADATLDGILVISRESRIVSWNRRLPALLEVSEEMLGKRDVALLSQALGERLVDPASGALEGRTRITGTRVDRLELRSGRVLERTRIVPSRGSGEETDVVLLFRDITTQVAAERQLQTRALQQAAVAELSQLALTNPAPQLFFDEALRMCVRSLQLDACSLVEVKKGTGALLVRSTFGQLATHAGELLEGEASDLAVAVIAEAVPLRIDEWSSERRFRCAALRAAGMRVGLAVPLQRGGVALGALSAHRKAPRRFDDQDQSFLTAMANVVAAFLDRLRSDEALRRSEENFRTILEGAPDGILVHRAGTVLYANATLRRLLGRSMGELAGSHLSSFVLPGSDTQPLDLSADGRASRVDVRVRDRAGVAHPFEVLALPIDIDGQAATIAIGRDVTERHELQSRLQLADRMVSVGTLAAGVAHELNNPLAYVLANLQLLGDELKAFAPRLAGTEFQERLVVARQVLEEATEGASRLRIIVRDLKTFSRGDGDALEPIDLIPVIESSLNMASNELRHRAQVVRRLQSVPPVFGNAARLGQVVLNLLVNAAQSIPEGKAHDNRVEVSTAHVDGKVILEVRDSGAGIKPEVVPRIFDPFFTTKPVGVGTGLGLSICQNIVNAMGGRIELESTVGVGTLFRVVLPPCDPEPVPERVVTSGPARKAVGRKRVLVIDDEPLVAVAVRRALQRDHDVTVVQSGRAGLELIVTDGPFDAVVSDLLMPDCTGMEIHERLTREHPQLARRLLFLTGGAFTEATRRFLEKPGIRSVEKPFDVEQLRAAVEELLSL